MVAIGVPLYKHWPEVRRNLLPMASALVAGTLTAITRAGSPVAYTVQTIKGIARGPWAAGMPRDRTTWYQPLDAMDDIRPAVHWILARPGIFLLSAGDVGILPEVLKAASEPIRPPAAWPHHDPTTGPPEISVVTLGCFASWTKRRPSPVARAAPRLYPSAMDLASSPAMPTTR